MLAGVKHFTEGQRLLYTYEMPFTCSIQWRVLEPLRADGGEKVRESEMFSGAGEAGLLEVLLT